MTLEILKWLEVFKVIVPFMFVTCKHLCLFFAVGAVFDFYLPSARKIVWGG
jgi:hypothetical protein